MKKLMIFMAFIGGLLMLNPLKSNAQFIVTARPERPAVVVERPRAPGPEFIWVDGEWRWSKREHRYIWAEGYWIRPKRGNEWVPGHWVDVRGGSEWIRGHWARRY